MRVNLFKARAIASWSPQNTPQHRCAAMLCPKRLISGSFKASSSSGNGRGRILFIILKTRLAICRKLKSMPRPLAALHAPFRRGNRHRAKPSKAAEALRQPNGMRRPINQLQTLRDKFDIDQTAIAAANIKRRPAVGVDASAPAFCASSANFAPYAVRSVRILSPPPLSRAGIAGG